MSLSVRAVMESVAARYGLSFADLVSPCRARRLSRPRDLAMYLARQRTEKSFPQLGRRFHRTHASILMGVRRVEAKLAADPAYAAEVADAARALDAQAVTAEDTVGDTV